MLWQIRVPIDTVAAPNAKQTNELVNFYIIYFLFNKSSCSNSYNISPNDTHNMFQPKMKNVWKLADNLEAWNESYLEYLAELRILGIANPAVNREAKPHSKEFIPPNR